MRTPSLALLLILSFTGAALAQQQTPRALADFRVTRPGLVLADPAERRAVLADWPAQRRRRACRAEIFTLNPSLPVVPDILLLDDRSLDSRMQSFVFFLMEASAEAVAFDDAGRAQAVRAALVRWARGRGLAYWPDATHPNTYSSVDLALLPIIASTGLVREGFDPAAYAEVEAWLRGLVERHEGPRVCFTCQTDHWRFQRDAVNMAFGALTGDAHFYRLGAARYLAALRQMRPDGGFPAEVEMEEFVLWSTARGIGSLVTIAEIAALQGQDLHGRRAGGRSLHHAVGFFLRNLAALERSGRLSELGRPGIALTRRQRLDFLYPTPHGLHALAWIEAYTARHPAHANSRRLRALVAEGRIIMRDAAISLQAGGNASCLLGRAVALTPPADPE